MLAGTTGPTRLEPGVPLRSVLLRMGWAAGVAVLALIATAATLALSGALDTLWRNFPGAIGLVGWVIVIAATALGLAGLLVVTRASPRWALLLGLGILVITRLAAVLIIDPPLERDPSGYDDLARGVLAGECCFDYRPMGFPIMLAGAYALGLSGKVVGLAAALLAGPLVWLLARRVAGDRAAGVALYVYAVTPSLILLTGVLLTEPVFATLLLVALVAQPGMAAAGGRRAAGAIRGAVLGALLGLAQYVRSTAILLVPAFVVASLMRRSFRPLMPLLAAFLLMMVPVFVATGGPFTSPLGGWTLLVGTNPEHDGHWNEDDAALYESWGVDREQRAREEAIRRIVDDPAQTAALAVRKVHSLWATQGYASYFAFGNTDTPQALREVARLLSQLVYVPLVIAAAAAAWRVRRAPPASVITIVGLVASVAAMHLLVEVQGRYHAYLLPMLAVLAAALLRPVPALDDEAEP